MNKKLGHGVYFAVGAIGEEDSAAVFHDVNMPGGETVRFMRRRLYQNALDRADRKLQEILGTRKDSEAGT